MLKYEKLSLHESCPLRRSDMPHQHKVLVSKFYVPKPTATDGPLRGAAHEQRFLTLTNDIEEQLLTVLKNPPPNAIAWKDFEAYATVLPEFQEEASGLITRLLGYLPIHAVLLPQEVLIRKEIDRFLNKKELPQQEFEDNIYRLIMQTRNLDMEKGGWIEKWIYDKDDMDRYMYNYAPYISMARERLFLFFEYYPDLIHSLDAELLLRSYMCRYGFGTREQLSSAFDYKVLTIIRYREIMHKEGKAAADASFLLGK